MNSMLSGALEVCKALSIILLNCNGRPLEGKQIEKIIEFLIV
jgi:hypothetical protein